MTCQPCRLSRPAAVVSRVMTVVCGLACALILGDVALAQDSRETARTTAQETGDAESHGKLDPAAWGSDHVGKAQPAFMSGDECLFCHRADIGPVWSQNRHQLTIRPAGTEPDVLAALKESDSTATLVSQIDFVMGRKNRIRFLKRTGNYGQLALLTTAWAPANEKRSGQLIGQHSPRWDRRSFGKSCAGCHTTAVDPKTRAFSALSLDCFTCHGDVPLQHSKDGELAIFSKIRNDPARVVVSICGQCHIRTGTSRSTGLPYANAFVAGDNLFRDLQVDWSDGALGRLNPGDRHALANIRDVVVDGKTEITCLSCHQIHEQTTERHQQLPRQAICANCHNPDDFASPQPYDVHSRVCGY